MRQIYKKYFFIAMSAGIALSGCSKSFLDINKDPNRVTDDNVTAELIFPAAAEEVGSSLVGARASDAGAKTNLQFLHSWIGYMAANGDFSRDPTETTYNLDFNFNDVQWQRTYGCLFDLHQAEVKAMATGDTALAAGSIILGALVWQNMVDLFGDIPYSQAFNVATVTKPAYDKAQDIYNSLELRLDTAIGYMGLPLSKKFAPVDIVNHGDVTKWIKFANTLKLRLLLRQSEMAGFSPTAELAKIFTAPSPGILGAGETVSENPGYVNDLNKQNPFYANYGYTPTGVKATSGTNANAYIIGILENNNDPRIGRFFDTIANGTYVGDVYGDEPGNIPSGGQSSYFGPAIVGSAAQDQWLIPSYESMFFYAEAVARGWVPGVTDAQAAYEAAVTESFVWLKVPDAAAAAATYMSSNTSANWANAGASVASQVKFIAYQKYIANTCIDPQESYEDQLRLNFLADNSYISLNPSKVTNTLPLRVLYPQSEYTTNAENVQAEGTITINTKIFWQP